jgi:hypothetical protein
MPGSAASLATPTLSIVGDRRNALAAQRHAPAPIEPGTMCRCHRHWSPPRRWITARPRGLLCRSSRLTPCRRGLPGDAGYWPRRWCTSARFRPAARTRTRTCSGPGSGVGTSRTDSTSGPPAASMTTARIRLHPFAHLRIEHITQRVSGENDLIADAEVPGDIRHLAPGCDQVQHAPAELCRIASSAHVLLLSR